MNENINNINVKTFLLFETNNCIESKMSFDFIDSLKNFNRFSGFFYNIRMITKSELINFLMFWGFDSTMINDNYFLDNLIFCFKYFKSESMIIYFMLNSSVSELYYIFSNRFLSKVQIYQMVNKLNRSIKLECWRFYVICLFNNKEKYSKFINFIDFKQLILSNVFFFDDFRVFYNYKLLIKSKNDLEIYSDEQRFFNDLFYRRTNFLEIIELLFDNFVYNLLNVLNFISYMRYTEHYNYYKFLYLKLQNKGLCFKYDRYNYKFIEFNYFLSILHELFCFFRLYIYKFYFLIKNGTTKVYINKLYKLFKYRFLLLLKFLKLKNIDFEIYCILLYVKIRKYLLLLLKNKNMFFILLNILNIIFYKFYKLVSLQVLYKKYFFYNLSELVIILLNNLDFLKIKNRNNEINFMKDIIFIDEYKKFNYLNFIRIFCLNSLFSYRVKHFIVYYYLITNNQINFINIKIRSSQELLTFRTVYWFFEGLNVNNYSLIDSEKKKFYLFSYINRVFFLSINYSLFKVLYNLFYVNVKNLYIPLKMRIKVHIENFFFFFSEEFLLEDFNLLLEDFVIEEMRDSDFADIDFLEDESDYLDEFYEEFELDEYFFFFYIDELISVNYYIYELLNYKYIEFSTLERSAFGVNDYFDFLYSFYSPLRDKEFIYFNDYEYKGYLEEEFDINTWYNWLSHFLIGDLIQFLPNIYEIYPSNNGRFTFLKKKYEISNTNSSRVLNLTFKVVFEYIYNVETKQYDLIFKYKEIYVDNLFYYIFMHEKFLTKDKINNYSGNIIIDEDIITEYSCFNEFFKKWVYYNTSNVDNLRGTLFDFFIGFNRDSGVRDLVILHEMWIWWEYMLRMYSIDFLNKFFYPRSMDELLFLNSYIISGLYSILMSDEEYLKMYIFRIFNSTDDLNKLVALIYYNLNINDFTNKEFLITENIDEKKFIKNIEVYYYKYLHMFNSLLFLYNYLDLYIYVYEYTYSVYKKTTNNINSNLYLYIKRIENIYMDLIHNSFMSFMGSYYLNIKKSNLLYFWETFFLSIIETVYSLVDFEKFLFFEREEGGEEFLHSSFMLMIPNLFRLQEAFVFEDYDFFRNINLCYLNKLYLLYLNPYLYLSKGLNVDYSITEALFFDMFELYMMNFTDLEQNDVDMSLLTQLKFFEGVDYEIRPVTTPMVLAVYFNDYVFVESIFERYKEYGFNEYVEFQAYNVVDFSNYYLMESYNKYLERYYSIYNYNIFLYGLFIKYLSKNVMNNFFFELLFNLLKEVKVNNFMIQKNLDLYINKNQYFVELIYYYIFCLFFNKIRIKSFSLYFLKFFFYFFLFFFKRLKISYYYYFFFLKVYSAYFFYLIIQYIKMFYKLKYNNERIIFYINKLFYKIIINNSIEELYILVKYLYKKIYIFIKLLLYSIYSYKYKYMFIFKYGKLVRLLVKNNYYIYIYNFFNKKNFLYKEEIIVDRKSTRL